MASKMLRLEQRTLGMRHCTAHSSRTGEPCNKWAVRGANVCNTHGGSTTHVKRAAEERIKELVDPALDRIKDLIETAPDLVALAAAKDVLDRAGLGARQKVDATIVSRFTLRIDRGDNDAG